jgi:soluble lytic murein transglycosylase
MSIDTPALRIVLSLSLIAIWAAGLHHDQPLAASVSSPEDTETCGSAEECFQAAALPKERLGRALTKDQVLSLKLERLKRIMERFPATLWAKRAGLLSGVLLVERNPAVAI